MQHLARNRASNRNTFKFMMHSATSAQLPMFSPWRWRGRESKRGGGWEQLPPYTVSGVLIWAPSPSHCIHLIALHCNTAWLKWMLYMVYIVTVIKAHVQETLCSQQQQRQVGILILKASRRQWKHLRFLCKCIVCYWLIGPLSVGTTSPGRVLYWLTDFLMQRGKMQPVIICKYW